MAELSTKNNVNQVRHSALPKKEAFLTSLSPGAAEGHEVKQEPALTNEKRLEIVNNLLSRAQYRDEAIVGSSFNLAQHSVNVLDIKNTPPADLGLKELPGRYVVSITNFEDSKKSVTFFAVVNERGQLLPNGFDDDNKPTNLSREQLNTVDKLLREIVGKTASEKPEMKK